jgi:uncharacterized protein YjbJ (UPF0337 family)
MTTSGRGGRARASPSPPRCRANDTVAISQWIEKHDPRKPAATDTRLCASGIERLISDRPEVCETGRQVAITILGRTASRGRPSDAALRKRRARMNADIMEGKWKQMRGQMKEWWGKLTDDDFDVIAGKRDQLVGKLQEKYGWAKRDAEDEVARRLREIDTATRPSKPAGTSRQ